MHQKKVSEETSCGITAWKVSAAGGHMTLCLLSLLFQLHILKQSLAVFLCFN